METRFERFEWMNVRKGWKYFFNVEIDNDCRYRFQAIAFIC